MTAPPTFDGRELKFWFKDITLGDKGYHLIFTTTFTPDGLEKIVKYFAMLRDIGQEGIMVVTGEIKPDTDQKKVLKDSNGEIMGEMWLRGSVGGYYKRAGYHIPPPINDLGYPN